jgi:hypothetical protein
MQRVVTSSEARDLLDTVAVFPDGNVVLRPYLVCKLPDSHRNSDSQGLVEGVIVTAILDEDTGADGGVLDLDSRVLLANPVLIHREVLAVYVRNEITVGVLDNQPQCHDPSLAIVVDLGSLPALLPCK